MDYQLSPHGELTASSWRSNCLLVKNSLSPLGELNVIFSSWRSSYLLMGNSLSFLVENLLPCFFLSLITRRFFVSSSGLLPLDQSLLVMPGLRSDFVDYRKFVMFFLIARSPWTNISLWCRCYGQTSSILRKKLLSSSCLVATFIRLLLYYHPFYFMMLSQILRYHSLYETTA